MSIRHRTVILIRHRHLIAIHHHPVSLIKIRHHQLFAFARQPEFVLERFKKLWLVSACGYTSVEWCQLQRV
jgi:hypothetical protein